MRAVLNEDSKGGLGIPYGFEEERRFWNLRRFPELIDAIPELKDTPSLYDFVRRVNAPGSRFATLGCERWMKEVDFENGATRLCGTYVDICGDRMELISRENYVGILDALAERGAALRAEDQYSDRTLVELEPQRVEFRALRIGGWVGTFWIAGLGNSDEMAAHYRDRGLKELVGLLEADSRSITEAHGTKGTTIFERLSDNGDGV